MGSQHSASLDHLSKLAAIAGVTVNGDAPWDLRIHDNQAADRILAQGSMGLGESYMDGQWDCEHIDQMIARLLTHHIDDKIKTASTAWHVLRARFVNNQSRSKAWEVGQKHYDLGNEFFRDMLDARMTYTCGYWDNASTLDEAQEAKLDLVCQKLGLKPGMTVLDIGCGWGSFMRFAAERYGVQCTGITISKEQAEYGRTLCEGLPIQFVLQDYRDIQGKYDRIVSLGMFEHVGRKNYRTYFEAARRNLKEDGLFLMHTIGGRTRDHKPDPWIHKYIFPNGEVPVIGQVADNTQGLFLIEDLHSFGADYDKTLMAWHANFEKNWEKHASGYSERFYRMWRYYLLICAGSFRARENQLWQFVLSPNGVAGGYRRPKL